MFFLKASLKALVNLTNIPCFQPEENYFNPKGNRKAKRNLFLDKSPSSVTSPRGPGANLESHPSTMGLLGTGTDPSGPDTDWGHQSSVCTFPALSRARIRPRMGLCLPLQVLHVHLRLLNVFTCLISTPLSHMLEEQFQSLQWGL